MILKRTCSKCGTMCSSTAIYCTQCGEELPEPVLNDTAALLLWDEAREIVIQISSRNALFDPHSNHPDKVLYGRIDNFINKVLVTSIVAAIHDENLTDLITAKGLGQQLDKAVIKRLERFSPDTVDPDQELYQRIHDLLELLDDSL